MTKEQIKKEMETVREINLGFTKEFDKALDELNEKGKITPKLARSILAMNQIFERLKCEFCWAMTEVEE